MLVFTSPVCQNHVNANSPVESPKRYPAMLAGLEAASEAGATLEYRDVEPAARAQLLRVHDPDYLTLIRKTSEAGGGYLDGDTAVNEHSWEATCVASGAAVGAVEAAMDGEASFAVVRPPGHHAGADYAMGFCLTNHSAVTADHARHLGAERVAVLDWDVHHGNGTQDIFYDRDDVIYLSVHRGGYFYPGTGQVEETGAGSGEGFTVNVPLPARTGDDVYEAVFERILLPVLREYTPDVLIVSAGYDAHAADPLGGMSLDASSFGRFAASLVAFTREVEIPPPAFVMEGGYDLRALSECVAATIVGAESGEVPSHGETRSATVEDARKVHSLYWNSLK